MRVRFWIVMLYTACCLPTALAADVPKVTTTVKELWADFDPRKEALDAKVVREWEKDGIVYRYVTYHIGTFKGKPARMAAFFGFPKGSKKLPGLLHLHGGGQRAFLHEVEFYAKRGYACLSINWGGREMENAKDGDPNTDWGAVDPTQKNVPGYFNLKPGDKYLDPFDSPRNNNWYLLTLGARRGLTFLEQQPEVDADTPGRVRSLDGRQPDGLRRRDGQPGEGRFAFGGWVRIPHRAVAAVAAGKAGDAER